MTLHSRATLDHQTICYEYPLNERVRMYLRLEYLLKRLQALVAREGVHDHHFAILTLFEITEVGARTDLRGELLRDLERMVALYEGYKSSPDVNAEALHLFLSQLQSAIARLNAQTGKLGQSILANEWLHAIRNRIHIPGGTCEFDLPAYYAWQQQAPAQRCADLRDWKNVFEDYASALDLVLHSLRESVVWTQVAAQEDLFQQILPSAAGYQLAMVRIGRNQEAFPVISGTRLMLSVRMQKVGTATEHPSLKKASSPTAQPFLLGLCA